MPIETILHIAVWVTFILLWLFITRIAIVNDLSTHTSSWSDSRRYDGVSEPMQGLHIQQQDDAILQRRREPMEDLRNAS